MVRSSRFREWANLIALVLVEAALFVGLLVAGRYLGAVSLSHFATWVRRTQPDDAIWPLFRLVALVVAGWLLASTGLYAVLAVGDSSEEGVGRRQRSRRWRFTPAVVRRIVDGVAAASIVVSAVGASGGLASAAPMPAAVTARPTAVPTSGAVSGSSATVSGARFAAGGRGVVSARSSGPVSEQLVGRHLPHPGVVDHDPPPRRVFTPDPSAPSVANGFAGLPVGTKVVVVQSWSGNGRDQGDCLSVIAQQHLDDWRLDGEIAALNKGRIQFDGGSLQDDNWVYPGWVLIMPANAVGTLVVGASPASSAAASSSVAAPGGLSAPVGVAAPAHASSPAAAAAAGGASQTSTPAAAPTVSTPAAPSSSALATPAVSVPAAPPATSSVSSLPRVSTPRSRAAAAAPAPAPSRVGDLSAGGTSSTARHGDVVPLPVELLGAGLLSAGLVALIRRRTAAQRARRRFGRRIPRPTGEQARVELAARIGADEDGASFVDVGLRYLARAVQSSGQAAPEVLGAELYADRLVVLLGEGGFERPAGFDAGDDDMSWVLPRFDDGEAARDLEALVGDVVAPLPAMLTLGRCGEDGEVTVLANAEAVGIISIGGDIVAARQVVAAAAVELATAPWSQLARVYMVGFGRPDGLGDTDPAVLAATLEECLPALRAEAEERRAHVRNASTGSAAELRVQGEGTDLGPSVVLCVKLPDTGALAELDEMAADPTSGVTAVIAGDVGDAVSRGWALELDERELIDVGPLGRQVRPQFLSYRVLEAIEGRIAVATDPDDVAADEPAQHWYPAEADDGTDADLDDVAADPGVGDDDLGDDELVGEADNEGGDRDDDDTAGSCRRDNLSPPGGGRSAGQRVGSARDSSAPLGMGTDMSPRAQESVLGRMMLSRDAVTAAAAACDAKQFSTAVYGQIFDAICAVVNRGETAGPAAVAAELHRRGQLEQRHGLELLIGMQADAAVERALAELAALPVPIPDYMRHPLMLAQVLRPSPRVVRVQADGLDEITWKRRTRSLEAVIYKSFYPDCSNKQLATILSAGQRRGPGDNGAGYNAKTFRTTMNVARGALGVDAAGRNLLTTKSEGVGQYVLLNGLQLDWNIFKMLVNAASAAHADDVGEETRIRLVSTALDLVAVGGPFSGVSLRSGDTFWKWIEVGPSNLRGEMEAHILDAAHWLAELCLERGDYDGVRRAVSKGRSVTTLDQALNCNLLDMELSVHGPAALDAAFAEIEAGYMSNAAAEETDDPVAPEVREHYHDLKVAAGG